MFRITSICRWVVLGIVGLSLNCSDDAATCVAVDTSCTPLYEPVFDEIFTRTIKPKCGVDGRACHGSGGAKAGMVLEEVEASYVHLVDEGRVVPMDSGCSLVVQRLDGQGGLMPPGDPLSEAEQCTIQMWIDNGAKR